MSRPKREELPPVRLTFNAYVACTPRGAAITSTIRQTPDESWRELRRSMTDPDVLAENGWHVRRCILSVGERVDDR